MSDAKRRPNSTSQTRVEPPVASEGRKNVLIVVLDDVGFGQLGCYGGSIRTPHMDAIAQSGVRLTSFHTTALCAPTRSSLLTGRNHHRNGMGSLPLRATADPGYSARTPRTHGYLSEVLRDQGYATYALGKWHLTPYEDLSAAGPFEQWPLGRGFDRFYGFMHAETSQWQPRLVRDNGYIDPPTDPGYHLSSDLADVAIQYLRDLRSADPARPFFLYFCLGAAHAPLHAPKEHIDAYRGAFDHGWAEEARRVLARQKELGLVPADAQLPVWPDGIPDWDELDFEQRQVAARLQEVFAGFLTHADEQIGRVIEAIRSLGELDDTVVVVLSDNGASGEGGDHGTVNELRRLNRLPESTDDNFAALDVLGGPETYPHYPTGWALAGNTPFRNMKKWVHEGGIADPCIIRAPWASADGGLRPQYQHVTDIAPTVLDLLEVEAPSQVGGYPQESLDGASFAAALRDSATRSSRHVQYYESMGQRALWRDGWKAVTNHVPQSGVGRFDEDGWELYDTASDPTETTDLAAVHPDRLTELRAEWDRQAAANNVLPLDDSKTRNPLFLTATHGRTAMRYYSGGAGVQQWTSLQLRTQSYRLTARIDPAHQQEGAIFTHGGRLGGFGLFTVHDEVGFVYNFLDIDRHSLIVSLPASAADVRAEFRIAGETSAEVRLVADGAELGRMEIPRIVQLRFDAEGTTFVGRDPFGVLQGFCSPKPRTDVDFVDVVLLDIHPVDMESELDTALRQE